MPLMAILPVLLVRWAGRKPVRWLGAFLAALVAVASHLLLDLTNAYGIRLLLPFSGEWLRLDLTGVIDLWIWGAVLLGMAAPFVAGWWARRSARARRARGITAGVRGLRAVLRAALQLRARRSAQPGAGRAGFAALPAIRAVARGGPAHAANPLLWRGIVETSEFYAVEDVDLAGEFDPARAEIFRKPASNPAIDAASRTETFRRFLEFSQYPLWRVSPAPDPENGRSVELLDMRFGTPLDPGFMASAVVDSQLRVRSPSFSFGTARPR